MDCSKVDQRQSRFGIVALLEMRWRFDEQHFERRPNMPLEEVAAARASVGATHHDVRVHRWLSLVDHNVANERQDFHLLYDRDPLVLLGRPVEVAQRHIAIRADSGEPGCAHVVFLGERRQSDHDLIAGLEDQGEGSFAGILVEES